MDAVQLDAEDRTSTVDRRLESPPAVGTTIGKAAEQRNEAGDCGDTSVDCTDAAPQDEGDSDCSDDYFDDELRRLEEGATWARKAKPWLALTEAEFDTLDEARRAEADEAIRISKEFLEERRMTAAMARARDRARMVIGVVEEAIASVVDRAVEDALGKIGELDKAGDGAKGAGDGSDAGSIGEDGSKAELDLSATAHDNSGDGISEGDTTDYSHALLASDDKNDDCGEDKEILRTASGIAAGIDELAASSSSVGLKMKVEEAAPAAPSALATSASVAPSEDSSAADAVSRKKAKDKEFFATQKAVKAAQAEEEVRAEEARVAAMDEETRATYLKDKADQVAHELQKDKMLKNQLKGYKKKGKSKGGRGKRQKGRGKKK